MARCTLGLILPNYGESLAAERLSLTATAAEEAGFDSGWVTDHIVVPAEHAPVYGTIAEALVSLGFLAARTRRLELGVSALVVPERNPLVVLKQLATLGLLSGGRIVTLSRPAGSRVNSHYLAPTSVAADVCSMSGSIWRRQCSSRCPDV